MLSGLQSDLDANEEAMAAKESEVTTLNEENDALMAQIAAIDAQLALGGCIA